MAKKFFSREPVDDAVFDAGPAPVAVSPLAPGDQWIVVTDSNRMSERVMAASPAQMNGPRVHLPEGVFDHVDEVDVPGYGVPWRFAPM